MIKAYRRDPGPPRQRAVRMCQVPESMEETDTWTSKAYNFPSFRRNRASALTLAPTGRSGVLDIDPHPDGKLARPQLALQLALPLGLAKAPWYLRLLCPFG